ncbi:hypothetical protein FRB97_002100 [Tulasnella sp. 331]|nr:hypothetical protein FRB97_002100 [Tulasnella sp. 331]
MQAIHSPESLLRESISIPEPLRILATNSEPRLAAANVDPGIDLFPFDPQFSEYELFGSILERLQRCRRRPVRYTTRESSGSRYPELFYHECALPVVDMFNQIRDLSLPPIRSTYEMVLDGQAIKITFEAPPETRSLPIVIALAPGTFQTGFWKAEVLTGVTPTPDVTDRRLVVLLKELLGPDSDQYALITDTHGAIIAQRRKIETYDRGSFNCEVIVGQPVRLTLAACLNLNLSLGYMDENIMTDKSPKGALNAPTVPVPSDEDTFRDRKSISDFDLYTLYHDKTQAEQFFRWKARKVQEAMGRPCVVGDILVADANAFDRRYTCPPNAVPLIPFPPHTAAYLDEARRPQSVGTIEAIQSTDRFEVRITRVMKTAAEGSQIAAVYEVTLGDQTLCLKVFDDRLYPIEPPENPSEPLRYWFDGLKTAADSVRTEQRVYQRLVHAQGSVIPWYYGAHSFTLPDGHQTFGILMEFVKGSDPEEADLGGRTEAEQIAFIKSARHAVRVLQYGDISQLDWESTQIICAPRTQQSSSGRLEPSVGCVFIDFTSATQSDTAYNSHQVDDYGNVLEILSDPVVGLPKRLLVEHFEPREDWDYYITNPLKDMD